MEGVGDVAVGAERDQDHEPQPEGHQRQPCRAVLSDAVFSLQNNLVVEIAAWICAFTTVSLIPVSIMRIGK